MWSDSGARSWQGAVALALHTRGRRVDRGVGLGAEGRAGRPFVQWRRLHLDVSGEIKFAIGFLIDPLTALMITVVSFVSLMVHVYTVGYMADDPGYTRFFAYISLFTFSMLMLVMANNFLQLFFGWEAVGLVSYLLIGFWYTRPTANYASLKAFLANRVGDFGFVLGIGLIVAFFGSLDYATVFAAAPKIAGATLNRVGADQQLVGDGRQLRRDRVGRRVPVLDVAPVHERVDASARAHVDVVLEVRQVLAGRALRARGRPC